jgi:hypothetical protein
MGFESARKLADAVLLEGYVLYPYRASSTKNRFRWAFGVVAPRKWSESGGCEEWWIETQCLLEPPARLRGTLRFLHAEARTVESPDGRALESLDCGGRLLVPWDEGRVREIELCDLLGSKAIPFSVEGEESVEEVRDADGRLAGRLRKRVLPLRGVVRVRLQPVEADRPLLRLCVRVENESPCADAACTCTMMPRDEALRSSLIAAHLLLEAQGTGFLALVDPPEWAAPAAAACKQSRSWPVLAGPPGSRDTVLAAPIILYDHAAIAPESPADLFDNTEIDEILALRTMTLTDEEKREARATDPRARALIDRVDSLPPEMMSKLHGALRGLHRGEMVPRPAPRGCGIGKGARVRLRPPTRRTDAQDLLFAGRSATVEAVLRDDEDREYLAVTIDDDPAAELHRWYGRFHYYRPDEVEPL